MALRKPKKAVEVKSVLNEKSAGNVTQEPVKTSLKKTVDSKPVSVTSQPGSNGAYVTIDFPKNGETVSGMQYAIKIGASGNGNVEISFNNGEWKPCRHSVGYWWFDWGYYTPGKQTINVRLVDNKGTLLKKDSVKCKVV